MTTDNVAHRFAVEWDDDQGTQVGVFIPRRDTNSRITALAGDRVFPGVHHLARFTVQEHAADLRIGVASRDGTLGLSVVAREATSLGGKLFGSLEDAVTFFRRGSLGYSPSGITDRLMGVRLHSQSWDARPVAVEHMASTMFDNTSLFPIGSCTLDFALVMRNLTARWQNEGPLDTRSEMKVA
jgi:hypothetical protein